MQSKWIVNSYNRESASNPRMRPGTFSNNQMISKHAQDSHANKTSASYYVNYKNQRDKSPVSTSYDHTAKAHTHTNINCENDIFTSILEAQGLNMNNEKHHYMQQQAPNPLMERNSNQIHEKDSRNQSQIYTGRYSASEKQNKTPENIPLKPTKLTGQYILAANLSNINRSSNSRSPGSYSHRRAAINQLPATSSKKPVKKAAVNDENVNTANKSKVMRSQSSLNLRPSSENKNNRNSSESKTFINQTNYGIADRPETNEEMDDFVNIQSLKKENYELTNNVNKLNGELQNEKKKTALLEAEVENFKDDLIKEREKYKEELFKISQQIKKLRNIQNIYVTEKKNSEKLENQLNVKDKALNDVSYLLCENLKTMVHLLEVLLVKGDAALDNQVYNNEFSPEGMYKLFLEMRRNVIPRIEEAENFKLEFEWRNNDYKDIMAASREMLKPRRNTSTMKISSNQSHSQSQSKDFEIHHAEKKPIMIAATANYNSSGKSGPARGNWNTRKSTDGSVTANNKSTLNTTNDEENRLQQKPGHQQSASTSQKNNNDYVPIGARINLVEINMEEDVEQAEAEVKTQNKILEELNEESFVKKRVSSVSKFIEADSNFRDNMAESLGSTIVPRTNNCSGFNETFENFLGEGVSSRFQNEERKFIGDNLSGNNSKCYDLPVSISNIGGQLTKSSSELDAARNKIMKRKQNIEAKRQAAYDQGYFLSQPGITENSEESISSFQKTMEYDSLQKPGSRKGKGVLEDTLAGRDSEKNENDMGKRASLSPTPKVENNNHIVGRTSEPQSRLIRSTSAVTVGINLEKASGDKNKKEMLTEESNSERQNTKQDEPSNNPPVGKIPESFAIAKFDYNAQKENDLSFSKGDKIRILRKTETGWWIGLCNNKIGYFPYNFVNVVEEH